MSQSHSIQIGRPADVAALLRARWAHVRAASFGFLCLDEHYDVLWFAPHTAHRSFAQPEWLVELATQEATLSPAIVAVVTARYVPDALFCPPGDDDQAAIRALRPVFSKANVRLLDHFVVSRGSAISLCAQGLLP